MPHGLPRGLGSRLLIVRLACMQLTCLTAMPTLKNEERKGKIAKLLAGLQAEVAQVRRAMQDKVEAAVAENRVKASGLSVCPCALSRTSAGP